MSTHPKYRLVRWPATGAPDYGKVEMMGVSADPSSGRVYAFQRSERHPVLIFDREGRFLSSWGAGLFNAPHGCRIGPDGNLWLTDNGNHRVLKFTPDGKLLLTLGVRGKPGTDATHFNRPADITFGPDGSVYVADGYGNAHVVHISATGKYLGAWGKHGTGKSQFHLVHSIAFGPDGRLYVADRENQRIQIFTPTGRYITQWNNVGYPFGLAFTPQGNIVVSDGVANTVSLYDLQARLLTRWGGTGSAPGKFHRAHQLCVDPSDGSIYVAEVLAKRIQKFVPVQPPSR